MVSLFYINYILLIVSLQWYTEAENLFIASLKKTSGQFLAVFVATEPGIFMFT